MRLVVVTLTLMVLLVNSDRINSGMNRSNTSNTDNSDNSIHISINSNSIMNSNDQKY